MLAGLCNLCEDYGYSNFASLKDFVDKVRADCHHEDLSGIVKNIDVLHRYLKTKFSHEVCCMVVVIHKLNRAKCNFNHGQSIFNYSKVDVFPSNGFCSGTGDFLDFAVQWSGAPNEQIK